MSWCPHYYHTLCKECVSVVELVSSSYTQWAGVLTKNAMWAGDLTGRVAWIANLGVWQVVHRTQSDMWRAVVLFTSKLLSLLLSSQNKLLSLSGFLGVRGHTPLNSIAIQTISINTQKGNSCAQLRSLSTNEPYNCNTSMVLKEFKVQGKKRRTKH